MNNNFSLNPKQKIYLTVFAWLAALVLLVVLIAVPLVSQIKSDGSELAQDKQDMESFYKEWQALESAQKDYQALQGEINALPAFLPTSEALKFIVLIEKFAQATDNTQTVSVINKKDLSSAKKTTDFQISLRGNFPNLVKFLVYLENAPYYNDVKALGAQRLSEKEGTEKNINTGDINTILTVSVYQ
ncbi:MAG TPA: hypothetical protein P5089_03105 [Candidatus Portnoybacteria bacterium]|nr:hypothetical protein [Candidatus Portnoybacteria bacterium]